MAAERFCLGRDFTAEGLRNAATVIDGPGDERAEAVPLARVVRRAEPERQVPNAPALTVEFGSVRVNVQHGCDAGTLETLLEVVARVGGGR